MKKLLSSTLLVLMTLVFTGCNEQVPQGTVAKVLGPTGFQPEVYPPGVVNIDNEIWVTKKKEERLIFVETTTKKFVEPVKVLLKDKLTLRFTVVFRGRNTVNKKRIDAVFNDMKLNDNMITTEEVYNVYGKMVILNTARSILSKYNVDEVNTNYERITVELFQALEPKLKGLPIDISDVTIGEIQYPDIITTAIEKAKERRMKIETEKANVQIALTRKKGQEEIAKAEYKIKMLEAKRIRDYNAMTAKGITPELLELRKLELRQLELEKWNGVYPLDAKTIMGANTPVIVNTKGE
jgi:hypothetical protein